MHIGLKQFQMEREIQGMLWILWENQGETILRSIFGIKKVSIETRTPVNYGVSLDRMMEHIKSRMPETVCI